MSTKPRFALLSVSDKTGLVSFAKDLVNCGFKILSTGGTAQLLAKEGIAVIEAGNYTGAGELMDGRVKTLHPKIHGGILWDRNDKKHTEQAQEAAITPIDLVAVNLYPFEDQAVAKRLTFHKAIEFIDVGGPAMLRAAAKNCQHVIPVCDPGDYLWVADMLKSGGLTLAKRQELAVKVFKLTANYDFHVSRYLAELTESDDPSKTTKDGVSQQDLRSSCEDLPRTIGRTYTRLRMLRYGENPQQKAALYLEEQEKSKASALSIVVEGKELSYNNYLDLDAAWKIVNGLRPFLACVIVKHNNPCGVARLKCKKDSERQKDLLAVYQGALDGDATAAFGGIVAFNSCVDGPLAEKLQETFYECIIGEDFTPEAVEILRRKKNLRLLKVTRRESGGADPELSFKETLAGTLIQQVDDFPPNVAEWECRTKVKATDRQKEDLEFAFAIVKYVKSNAIVLVKNGQVIGVGAGQMSRIDAMRIAIDKARQTGKDLNDSVVASDAFFPFADCVELAAQAGAKALIQPGGSVRDADSIAAADRLGIAMIFSHRRHFLH